MYQCISDVFVKLSSMNYRISISLIVIFLISCRIAAAQSYYDYELKKINFSGNSFFSESDLKQNIESKESPMWFWIFLNSFTPFGDEPVYFDSSKISIDIMAIKELYHSNGFFLTEVDYSFIADTSDKTITLNYTINENKPFYYGSIDYVGLNKLPDFEIVLLDKELIELDSTKQFSETEIESNIASVRRFLANHGYIFGSYDSTVVSIDTILDKTNIKMFFDPRDRYTIKETIINKTGRSIDQISNRLIEEIADLKPGKNFDQAQIDRSELRLLKTELFSSLDINPLISDTVNKTIPIEINTVITSLNQLAPEIKADNEFNTFNAGLGISYTRKNFFGDARKLNISTSFRLLDLTNYDFEKIFDSSHGILDINLKMEQPFLFGQPILTSTELYLRSQTIPQDENAYGGTQRFDFEMPYYTFVTLLRPFIGFDIAERKAKFIPLTASNEIVIKVGSFTPGIGIEMGSSKTDDILFPTKGNFFFITPELFYSQTEYRITEYLNNSGVKLNDTSSIGNTYFYRIQTGFSSYHSITNDKMTVLAGKIRIGYAQPITSSHNEDFSSEELIPPNKTFYAGGSNSIRGWKARELIPTNRIDYAGYTTNTQDFRGGTTWFEGSFELRQKLNDFFGYAVFADYGNTWNGWKEIQINDIAVAIGLGVRVYTPIAPFRLDFGTKFYDPSDKRMIFKKNLWDNLSIQFGIGEAF